MSQYKSFVHHGALLQDGIARQYRSAFGSMPERTPSVDIQSVPILISIAVSNKMSNLRVVREERGLGADKLTAASLFMVSA